MPSSTLYAVLLALVMGVGCGEKRDVLELKSCYYCKESDVKYLAEVCKHCGKDPDGPNGKARRLDMTKIVNDVHRQQIKDKNEWDGISLIQWLGGLVVAGGFVFLSGRVLLHQYRIGEKELAEKERAEEERAEEERAQINQRKQAAD